MSNNLLSMIVMVTSGILLGALLQISAQLSREEQRQISTRQIGEPRWQYWKRMAETNRERSRQMLKTQPRSYWLVLVALYGLFVLMLVVLNVSPVRMIWWIFLPCFLVSFGTTQWIFQQAKAGRFSPPEQRPTASA